MRRTSCVSSAPRWPSTPPVGRVLPAERLPRGADPSCRHPRPGSPGRSSGGIVNAHAHRPSVDCGSSTRSVVGGEDDYDARGSSNATLACARQRQELAAYRLEPRIGRRGADARGNRPGLRNLEPIFPSSAETPRRVFPPAHCSVTSVCFAAAVIPRHQCFRPPLNALSALQSPPAASPTPVAHTLQPDWRSRTAGGRASCELHAARAERQRPPRRVIQPPTCRPGAARRCACPLGCVHSALTATQQGGAGAARPRF